MGTYCGGNGGPMAALLNTDPAWQDVSPAAEVINEL